MRGMDEQGERRASRAGEHKDWWSQLYSADASDTGRSRAGDTVDDRFDSVARTVGVEPSAPTPASGAHSEPGHPRSGHPRSGHPEAAGNPGVGSAAPEGARGEDSPGEVPEPSAPASVSAPAWDGPPADDAAPRGTASGGTASSGTATPSGGPPEPGESGEPGEPRGSSELSEPSGQGPSSAAGSPSQPDQPYQPYQPGQPGRSGPLDQRAQARQAGAGEGGDPRVDRLTTSLTVPESARLPRQPGDERHEGERPEGERYEGEGAESEERRTPESSEPVALPVADPDALFELAPDTVLDGGDYGTLTVRAVSLRGEAARAAGEPRRDALLTARFGSGENALLMVAVAAGADGSASGHRAARDICYSLGEAIGRSHARLAEDIVAGRRGALKSGLNRLTDRGYGKLRSQAAALGLSPQDYTAHLRCLLLPADPRSQIRVFFGVGEGGLFRLRDGEWQDIEPASAPALATSAAGGVEPSAPVSDPRHTMALGINVQASHAAATERPDGAPETSTTGASGGPAPSSDSPASPTSPASADSRPTSASGQPSVADPAAAQAEGALDGAGLRERDGVSDTSRSAPGGTVPEMRAEMPEATAVAEAEPEPFRFRASIAQPGDTLLMCGPGLAEPLRGEREFADELAERWADGAAVPDFAGFLADVRRGVPGHPGDRTAVAVWEG